MHRLLKYQQQSQLVTSFILILYIGKNLNSLLDQMKTPRL